MHRKPLHTLMSFILVLIVISLACATSQPTPVPTNTPEPTATETDPLQPPRRPPDLHQPPDQRKHPIWQPPSAQKS